MNNDLAMDEDTLYAHQAHLLAQDMLDDTLGYRRAWFNRGADRRHADRHSCAQTARGENLTIETEDSDDVDEFEPADQSLLLKEVPVFPGSSLKSKRKASLAKFQFVD